MNTVFDYIGLLRFTNLAVWLFTFLLIIIGYRYLRVIIGFVLINLYELFITNKNHLAIY